MARSSRVARWGLFYRLTGGEAEASAAGSSRAAGGAVAGTRFGYQRGQRRGQVEKPACADPVPQQAHRRVFQQASHGFATAADNVRLFNSQ